MTNTRNGCPNEVDLSAAITERRRGGGTSVLQHAAHCEPCRLLMEELSFLSGIAFDLPFSSPSPEEIERVEQRVLADATSELGRLAREVSWDPPSRQQVDRLSVRLQEDASAAPSRRRSVVTRLTFAAAAIAFCGFGAVQLFERTRQPPTITAEPSFSGIKNERAAIGQPAAGPSAPPIAEPEDTQNAKTASMPPSSQTTHSEGAKTTLQKDPAHMGNPKVEPPSGAKPLEPSGARLPEDRADVERHRVDSPNVEPAVPRTPPLSEPLSGVGNEARNDGKSLPQAKATPEAVLPDSKEKDMSRLESPLDPRRKGVTTADPPSERAADALEAREQRREERREERKDKREERREKREERRQRREK